MKFRFCKNYSLPFVNRTFTNFEFDDNGGVPYHMLRAKQLYWNEVIRFRDVSLNEILIDIGIPLEYIIFLEVDGDFNFFNNVTFKKGSAIDFGLGGYSDPQVKDFIEGKTSELVLDIKEI